MKKVRFLFLALYIILSFLIIFSSLQNASTSSGESGRLTEILKNIIEILSHHSFEIDFDSFHTFVRKAVGHFGLNFLSSSFGLLTYYSFLKSKKKSIIINLTVSLVIAISGEIMQLLSSGRNCDIKDMIINYSGAVCGSVISFVLILLINKKKRKKEKALI